MRQFTCPKAVTHPSTNRARCRATALIETNALPLHQTAVYRGIKIECHLCIKQRSRSRTLGLQCVPVQRRIELKLTDHTLMCWLEMGKNPKFCCFIVLSTFKKVGSGSIRFSAKPGFWFGSFLLSSGSLTISSIGLQAMTPRHCTAVSVRRLSVGVGRRSSSLLIGCTVVCLPRTSTG